MVGSIAGTVMRRVTDSHFFRGATKYRKGGVLVNRMGLQVARLLIKSLSQLARPRHSYPDVAYYVDVLDRDGVVVIPDFLSPAEFAAVKEEFEGSRTRKHESRYTRTHIKSLVWESLNLSAHAYQFPAIRAYVEENPVIYKLASAVLRRKIKYTAPVYAEIWTCPDPSAPNVDIENVLHADVHYPTVKLWLYMDDIDERNGAYIYARGSHRLTLARVMHEYEISIREAMMERGRAGEIPAHLVDRGRNRISDKCWAKMKIAESQICGKANTLVFSNNFGFHKRGVFLTNQERLALSMSFRYVDSLHHRVYPSLWTTPIPGNEYVPGRVPLQVASES